MPSSRPAVVNASSARSSCSRVSAADICVRMRAWPFGHYREREADDVDAELQQAIGHAAGERRIAEHHGNDGMLAGLQVESRAFETCAEVARVVEELLTQLR